MLRFVICECFSGSYSRRSDSVYAKEEIWNESQRIFETIKLDVPFIILLREYEAEYNMFFQLNLQTFDCFCTWQNVVHKKNVLILCLLQHCLKDYQVFCIHKNPATY